MRVVFLLTLLSVVGAGQPFSPSQLTIVKSEQSSGIEALRNASPALMRDMCQEWVPFFRHYRGQFPERSDQEIAVFAIVTMTKAVEEELGAPSSYTDNDYLEAALILRMACIE